MGHAILLFFLALALWAADGQRTMTPEDLFRVRRVGAVAWSPDGKYAAIEFSRPGLTLDPQVPTNEIGLLDAASRTMRILTEDSPSILGYSSAVWSPGGRRLAMLSVRGDATVEAWVWDVGGKAPVVVPGLDLRTGFGDPAVVWIDDDRLAAVAWDANADKGSDMIFHVLRGRKAVDMWRPLVNVKAPTVTVLESGRPPAPIATSLVAVDLRTKVRTTLAHGAIHQLQGSGDGRLLRFQRDPGRPTSSYFVGTDIEALYAAANWGTEFHVIDAKTGEEVAQTAFPARARKASTNPNLPLPRPDARLQSVSPSGESALFTANAADGSHLWMGSGGSFQEIWTANQWMAEIQTGRPERIDYTMSDGTPLTGWLLLPPNYRSGTRVPMVTIVYPGSAFGASQPEGFSLFYNDAEHAQLFAALGYAVLRPSMPEPKGPAAAHEVAALPAGVLPAVDVVIARGFADPDRVALLGQSDGGFATLAIITQTSRFRTAIASAGFSDLRSMYGTFYGQYRYGDAGSPLQAQLLRMLQLEKGYIELGGPPWQQEERYRADSSIFSVDKVQTPLMLIHGDMDYVPVQQAEEYFTALFRQDKRAEFVRYQGEWHTIAAKANVLDMWQRMTAWLSETMVVRH